MEKETNLKPIQCVCTNLKMASRVVGRAYDEAVETEGVNIIQYSILINIYRHETIPLARLAERLEMDRTTLYRALAVLEKNKLVRIEAADEGKTKLASLTAAGKSTTQKAETKWKTIHQKFIDKFGKDALESLNMMLADVRDFYR